MRRRLPLVIAGVGLVIAFSEREARTLAQAPANGRAIIATATSIDAGTPNIAALQQLRQWNDNIVRWEQTGELDRVRVEDDGLVPGTQFEHFAQIYRGVPVFGGDVVREVNQFGQAEFISGTYYPNITIDPAPTIAPDRADELIRTAGRGTFGPDGDPSRLTVLPTSAGFVLTWTARVFSARNASVERIFVDANSGDVVYRYDDTWTRQAADARTGTGTGVAGDRLKVPSQQVGPTFHAVDLLRPGKNTTYDMKADPARTTNVLNGVTTALASDEAQSANNVWNDPVVAAAQAYMGFTYEYYRKHFGRNGIDNKNLRLRLLVNPARPQDAASLGGTYPIFFNNAAYYGTGYAAFGVGTINAAGVVTSKNFAASIDIVAHEITHGVTAYTSNLIYQNESGALNESFSDMMSISVEFDNQPLGTGPGRADWTQGEDSTVSGAGIRSFSSPNTFGHPDHYSLRTTSTADNGGVHFNSSIVNHMFYLAIQGGTNRVSGRVVTGVGLANRLQIETTIYRAFTQLPSNATFSVARAATIQAARDLYGVGSAAERAITQAWDAVGVS